MTFITSRSTIDALMGPSIRTQTTSQTVSPRQQRALAIKSASAPNLLLSKEPTYSGVESADGPNSQSQIGSRLRSRQQSDPQQRLVQLQQFANIEPSSLHSHVPRRRSRRCMYNGSLDLGASFNLAPVIESGLSPFEEKADQDSFNFSMPNRRRSKRSSRGPDQLPVPQTDSGLAEASPVPSSPPATALLREQVAHKSGPYSAAQTLNGPIASLPDLHAVLHISHDDASANECEFNSLGIHSTMSSPELTCSSSLSSEEELGSRCSISSTSSVEDFYDEFKAGLQFLAAKDKGDFDHRNVEIAYASHITLSQERQASHGAVDKVHRILGPESPRLGSSQFRSPPHSPTPTQERLVHDSPLTAGDHSPAKKLFGLLKSSHSKSRSGRI